MTPEQITRRDALRIQLKWAKKDLESINPKLSIYKRLADRAERIRKQIADIDDQPKT